MSAVPQGIPIPQAAMGTQTVPMDDAAARAEAERVKAVLTGLIGKLAKEARSRVTERAPIEKRWLEDLQQYYGEYDDETLKNLNGAKKSTLFINETRPKTNACEARISDMLFPTDDKNWGIKPTPVPELTEGAKLVVQKAHGFAAQATQARQVGDQAGETAAVQAGNEAAQIAADAKAEVEEATKRASAMEAEIEDQLVECGYQNACRDVIRDACIVGTGILEGPVLSHRMTGRWKTQTDQASGTTLHVWSQEPSPKPAYYRVDYWDFFPDTTARTLEDSESFYIRNLMPPKRLRALAKQPGFDPDTIRELLDAGPRETDPTYLAQLRTMTGAQTNTKLLTENFQVWRYHGPITGQEMSDLCACIGRDDMKAGYEDADPLAEIHVVIWFCQDRLLKFGIHPLDSGEPTFSVFNLERDPASIFGHGVPFVMRDSQKAMNAGWRAMMDNAGLSSGPQIEIDTSVIEPVDGDWTMVPRKVWRRLPTAQPGKPGIIAHNIDSHQQELGAIIALAKEFIDEETAMPPIAQGETGEQPTQTAQGMSLMMNAANIVVRRIVRNFDDQLTVPSIRRLYHWNMQFSDKDYIKGDFDVDARGSSVLLLREIQANNLLVFLEQFGEHPRFGPYIKERESLEALVKANMMSVTQIIKTDEEMQADAEKQQGQQQQDPDQVKAQAKQADAQASIQLETLRHQNRMAEIQAMNDMKMNLAAGQMNSEADKLAAELQNNQLDRDHKERMFAAEAALTPDPRNDA